METRKKQERKQERNVKRYKANKARIGADISITEPAIESY